LSSFFPSCFTEVQNKFTSSCYELVPVFDMLKSGLSQDLLTIGHGSFSILN